jgi:hypothetical protein
MINAHGIQMELPPAWREIVLTEVADESITTYAVRGPLEGDLICAAITAQIDRRLESQSSSGIRDAVGRWLSDVHHNISLIDLPIGPSVRSRFRLPMKDGLGVQSYVQYVTPPLPTGGRVVVTFCMQGTRFEADMVRGFDDVALTLAPA